MKVIYQDVFREIKKSAGRFISLLLIVALGVAFYAGIRSCSPDMLRSADLLYDTYHLLDMRVISTMGITEDDLDAIRQVEGVKKAEGVYTHDFICRLGDSRDAAKVRSVSAEISQPEIVQGRQIQAKNECLLDNYFFQFYEYEIGDEIELLETGDEDVQDIVNTDTFRIVGSFTSPEYLSFDLGSTTIGSGKLNGLILVSDEVFVSDYYTQADILMEGTAELNAYSDAYEELTERVQDRLKSLGTERKEIRYNEVKAEAEQKIADAEQELADHKEEADQAEKEIERQEMMLEGASMEANLEAALFGFESSLSQEVLSQVEDGREQIEDAKRQLEEGRKEIAEGEEKLADAKKELQELKKPEWYVLDRNYLTEYSSFRSDADRIGNVGKVFPLIFFIVAALVCLTAMTRMVDEERTQIGTLKALGYSKLMIMRKYILYALFATAGGSIAGALTGSKVLPYVILNVYKLMYPNIRNLVFPYNAEHCLVASFAALICILAATFFACTRSLLENPAELMRPVSPKPGKKLLLERMGNVWKKIPFTWKNAFRNFVRYKKRLFMTLFGIIGSTALLLVGFGLKDAVNTILYTQMRELQKYDEMITVSTSADEKDVEALIRHIEQDDRFAHFRRGKQNAVTIESDFVKEHLDGYLLVPEDGEEIRDMIEYRDRLSGEHIPLPDDQVLISEKMSKVLQVKKGDTLRISEDNASPGEVTVGGIVENYLNHYVIMTPELYRKIFQEDPVYNQLLILNQEGVSVSSEELGNEYMNEKAVAGVSSVEEIVDKFSDMLKSMDSITLVLIICAGALTFVVLYNLNNINISERRRELATLKVLGFYDLELSEYIYRENIIITVIGIAAGIVAGYFLNRFVVTTVEVDIVMFGRKILASSYLFSILIAAGFTAVVNWIIHFKMKKIDMAASLKSVE